jgi:hypothetical protein
MAIHCVHGGFSKLEIVGVLLRTSQPGTKCGGMGRILCGSGSGHSTSLSLISKRTVLEHITIPNDSESLLT